MTRCLNCRADITVPATYTHGDHIKCGGCGMQHRVVRADDDVRLVVADAGPLKETLAANRQMVSRLEDEFRDARGSLGVGIPWGFGCGVAFVAYQVGYKDRQWDWHLVLEAIAVGLMAFIVLELVNYFFLAKRQRMNRLVVEIDEAKAEGRLLQQRIRDSQRAAPEARRP